MVLLESSLIKIDNRVAQQGASGASVDPASTPSIVSSAPDPSTDLDHHAVADHARESRSTRQPDADAGPPMDPRLHRLTKILLKTVPKTAYRLKSSTDETMACVRSTVTGLWPQRAVDTIWRSPDIYKAKTTAPPLMTDVEFLDSLRVKKVPEDIIESLVLVEVEYRGFDGEVHTGQIVGHQDVEDSMRAVFRRILDETDFPMTCVTPVSRFGWSDPSSVMFNNSSGFNWRLVAGSHEISDHSFGGAIDINPLINPWVKADATNKRYDPEVVGTLDDFSDVVRIFKEEGWKWGGDWTNSKDWQHFYRPEIPLKYFGKHEVPE